MHHFRGLIVSRAHRVSHTCLTATALHLSPACHPTAPPATHLLPPSHSDVADPLLDELERFRSDSGFLHRVVPGREVEAPELYEVATGEPDAREDPNPDRIGGELHSLLRSLVSCGPIPLVKVRPPEALVVPPFFGGIGETSRGDRAEEDLLLLRLYLKPKEKSPRVELGHLLGQCWPSPGGQLR